MYGRVDAEKLLSALSDDAYTVKIVGGGDELQFAFSVKDLFLKLDVDRTKAVIDLSGIYFKYKNMTGYASIYALLDSLALNIFDMPIDAIVETINAYLPDGWELEDVISIFCSEDGFEFDKLKAAAFAETFFKEGVSFDDAASMAEDGLTYEEVLVILPAETIAMINYALPEGYSLEDIMPMLKNVTPDRIKAIVDAFKKGELTKDLINAIMPDGFTVDLLNYVLPEGITADKLIEAINTVVNKVNEIDFDALMAAQKEAQAVLLNKVIDFLFVAEETDEGVKYTLNYGLIKEWNQYLHDTMIAEMLDEELGEGFVDSLVQNITILLDTQLSSVKANIEEKYLYNMTIEELLDAIYEVAEQIAPIIDGMVSDKTEKEINSLAFVKGCIDTVKGYLNDEVFMANTVAQAIEGFSGGKVNRTKIIEYSEEIVDFLKNNTVYSAALWISATVARVKNDETPESGSAVAVAEAASMADMQAEIDAMVDYIAAKIDAFADMLIEKYPVYFIINADGELEELSISAAIFDEDFEDSANISLLIKKGDHLGEVISEGEKTEMAGYATKYSLADFKDYRYAYYTDEYYYGPLYEKR